MALNIHEENRSEPHGRWKRLFVTELSASLLVKTIIGLLPEACITGIVGVWHVLIVIAMLDVPDVRRTLEKQTYTPGEFAHVRTPPRLMVHLPLTTPIPSPPRGYLVSGSNGGGTNDQADSNLTGNLMEQLRQANAEVQRLQAVVDGTAPPEARIGFFADVYEVWQSPAPGHEFVGRNIRLFLRGEESLRRSPEWAFDRCDDNVQPEPTGGDVGPEFMFSVPAETRCRVVISYFDNETPHNSGYWVNIRRSRDEAIGVALR